MRGEPFEGAVLTGGQSRRMGTDKAFVPVGGRPLVLWPVAALRDAGAVRVATVGGDLAGLGALGLDAQADPRQGSGPLGGILTALEAAQAGVVVVLACDLPAVHAPLVRRLVGALEPGDDAAVAVGPTGRLEPLVAAYRRRAGEVLGAAFGAGERAVHVALEDLALRRVLVDDDALLRNVNAPGDVP